MKRFQGQIFGFYLVLYAVLRFIMEFFRGDAVRGLYFNGQISTSQIIALFIILAAAGGMTMGWKKKPV